MEPEAVFPFSVYLFKVKNMQKKQNKTTLYMSFEIWSEMQGFMVTQWWSGSPASPQQAENIQVRRTGDSKL